MRIVNGETRVFELWIIDRMTDKVLKKSMKMGYKMGLSPVENAQVVINVCRTLEEWTRERFPEIKT